jgi:hypothetical protein
MTMTIREYVERQAIIIGRAVYVAIVAAALLSLPDRVRYGLIVLAVMVGVVSLLKQRFVRCPRCNGDLPTEVLMINSGDVQMCPHCGASFDKPYTRGQPRAMT